MNLVISLCWPNKLKGGDFVVTIQEEARQCERTAEIHLVRAQRSTTPMAREANLNLAAIYAARSERLRAPHIAEDE